MIKNIKGCKTCKYEPKWEIYDNGGLIGKCQYPNFNPLPALPATALISFRTTACFEKDLTLNIQNCPTWEEKEDENN